MTPRTVSILTYPHPKSHIVFPYNNEAHIAEAVRIFTEAGLDGNEAVVLFATREKRRALEQVLAADGFNVEQLTRDGKLTILEADQVLCQFLDAERPDAARFKRIVDEVISSARAKSPSGRVRVYGEMVNLLCGHNNVEAAANLEALWNEAIDLHCVALLCSYSTELLQAHACTGVAQTIMDSHSHIAA